MRIHTRHSYSGAIDTFKTTQSFSDANFIGRRQIRLSKLEEKLDAAIFIEKTPVQFEKGHLCLQDPQVLPTLFSRSVDSHPQNVAVSHGGLTMTYKQLDKLSNRYADYLQKVHHIRHGDMVCVAYDRGMHFMVAILAILKCGGAYVPIDVKEPLQRRHAIVEDVSPKLVLVQQEYRNDFALKACVSIENLNVYSYSPEPKNIKIGNNDIAVVFYTSGSTGTPKGVMLPHIAISGLISNPRYLNINSEDKVLSSSSIAFDAASLEIWLAFGNAATLVCIDYETIINPESYSNFLDEEEITVLWITSALFDQVVSFQPDVFRKVKYLMSGGDVVNPKTVYKVLNNKNGRPAAFINGYGPTETGIISTLHMIEELNDEMEPLSIGKAVADTVLYVLDENLKPVKYGEPGELYIGGPRLAKGYLNLPSVQSFLPNPFSGNPVDRIYRTGDLVSFRPDGSLAFHGRADRQIKFRGFRLELDGIENTLVSHPDVANAAVKVITLQGEKALVGYIQTEDPSKHFSVNDYKSYLNSKMPAYSVPRFITVMDKLPVTQRGKIDRKMLPDPVVDIPNVPRTEIIIEPTTETQKIIYKSWSKFLGVNEFSITDDFFDLGGSSILLPSVYADIRRQTHKFSFEAFLKNPTVERLGQIIDDDDDQNGGIDEHRQAIDDAILDAAIEPHWEPKASPTTKLCDKAVLLTGATGFLGAHILLDLLERTDRNVYCLVRPGKSGTSHDRLFSALKNFKVNIPTEISEMARIHIVEGDLSKPSLGLNPTDYSDIVNHCSHIIHCGAQVNHILPYSRLKAANSTSTKELIKIAMQGCGPKKLSFISTASAVADSTQEGTVAPEPGHFFGGYAMSKWVSEKYMEQAMARGLKGMILRPGNVFANSKTGVTSPAASNFALLMMNAYLESGLAPDLKLGFEAVPVDQLATAIVSMTLKEEEEEENEDMKNRVRHHGMMLNLTNPNELSLKDYVQILSELKNKSNPKNKTPIEIIPFAEWKRRVIDQIPESSPLYSLTLYFQKEEEHDSSLDQPLPLEEELTHFETNLAQSELAKHGIVYPCDYKKLLETVVY